MVPVLLHPTEASGQP